MTDTLDATLHRLRSARRHVDRRAGEARHVATTGKRLLAEVADLSARIDLHTEAAALLASIGEERQAQTWTQIETLVTEGLHTIFGPDLSFHLVPGTRNRTPVIDLVVRSRVDGEDLDTDVLDARGGGLAAVIGFLLRLVNLLLAARAGDTVTMLLDEPFAHVSAEYEHPLAAFIRELVDRMPVQITLVTHSDVYADYADARYRFAQTDGITRVAAF